MKDLDLYFAACSKDGGVYHYILQNGELVPGGFVPLDRPMYMIRDGEKIYVLLRAPFSGSEDSGLISLAISESGELIPDKGEITSTQGIVACHLCAFHDNIYAANYLSGSVFATNGCVDTHSGHGVNPVRQDAPHTHCVIPTPEGNYLVSSDLGLDTVYVYDDLLRVIDTAKVPQGHGPRHLAFTEDGRFLFCINELKSTVSTFRYENGHLEYRETVSALPEPDDHSFAAAIRVQRDRVYVSHRGRDAISCLKFEKGKLNLLYTSPCGGASPRDFIIAEDKIFCTNEISNEVSVLDIHEDGIEDTGIRISMPTPLCALAFEKRY